MENLLDTPGAMNKVLKDFMDRKYHSVKLEREKIKWPRVEGLMRGRVVWIIGNSPSLLKIPDFWEKINQPGLITVAINRAIDRMTPTFWFAGDEELTTQYGNILPGEGPDTSQTVQILSTGAGAALKMGTPWVPFKCHLRDKGWGRHLDKVYHYPTSDLQSLQIFHGCLEAATTFMVGVDHAMVDGLTHAFEITGLDLEKQKNLHEIKYGEEISPHQAMIEHGYKKARSEARRTNRRIYTCSPVEGTVVRKYIPHADFDEAIALSLAHPPPPDLTELLSWKPYGSKYKITFST